MRSWASGLAFFVAASAPFAASAADVVITGKGTRMRVHDPAPVFVLRDDFAGFEETSAGAPPRLEIHVRGDVVITSLPDGSLRISFEREDVDEEAAE
jgi:hypothetical protein